MEIKKIINKIPETVNKIGDYILFYLLLTFTAGLIILLFISPGYANLPRIALAVSLSALIAYLYLKNKDKNILKKLIKRKKKKVERGVPGGKN